MADAAPIDSLLDILELTERIERQSGGLTREAFLQDPDVQDATAYRLLAIGGREPEDLPPRNMGMARFQILVEIPGRLSKYFTRESEIIWETIKARLPKLAAVYHSELARLGWSPHRET